MSSAVNDVLSGAWSLINAAVKGEIGDFFRTLKTRPGIVMVVCAIIGKIFFRQPLSRNMITGIGICLFAGAVRIFKRS